MNGLLDVKVDLTQDQTDALISYLYNAGENSLRTTRLLQNLNRGDYQSAANEFSIGKWTGGLLERRKREQTLFRTGGSPYPVTPK